MKKIKEKKSRLKLVLIPAILIILVGLLVTLIVVNKKEKINTNLLETNRYTLKYDETWNVKENTDTKANLVHDTKNGEIDLEIIELEKQYQYSEIDELLDEIIYNASKNNTEYNLLKKEKKELTKNEYPGYKLLYENNENQVMISIFKIGEKIVVITYEAENTYFDILLDSVNTIIYNFELKEEKTNLSKQINIETKNIEYKGSEELDNNINETTQHEIANNNFYVNYSLPSKLQATTINSTFGQFDLYDFENGRMNVTTAVYAYNIYEVIGDTARLNMLSEYESNKEEKDFEESLEKIEKNGYSGYIYRNRYYTDDILDKNKQKQHENAKIIYALNANHVFIITIQSADIGISEKFLDNIYINSIKNYSSYIKNEKENGNNIGILKKYTDYSKEKTEEIKISIPEKYKEQDTKQNIYEHRKYVIDYNEELEDYNYEVEFETSTLEIPQILDIENKTLSTSYGKVTYYTEVGEKTINSKPLIAYTGAETKMSGIMYTDINRKTYNSNKMILFYKLEEGYLVIKITANEKEITDELLNEVINFNVEIK